MNVIRYPKKEMWAELLKRPVYDYTELFDSVQGIINTVAEDGDIALKRFTRKFDDVVLEEIAVSKVELTAAAFELDQPLKDALDEAQRNIEKFHMQQVCKTTAIETTPGVKCWQKTVPIQKVGLYVPGGSAPLLSTVLMLGVPARLAGCREIVLCTPPGKDGKIHPGILYIANKLGITSVFKVGGVQAIAAMAYGTDSIPAVNKIFGPGNQYVMAAKQIVSRDKVAIDIPAGPSEVAILADESCNPAYVAADLLAQAEHGPDSQVILITDSEKVIHDVQAELELQLQTLPRKEIAVKSLLNSKLFLVKEEEDMVDMINFYAPEHLIIVCRNYNEMAARIVNAGSVFLGNFTPESAGDYASGTNHTLPTNGWAHAYSGLNLDNFVKKISFQEISRYGLLNISHAVMAMAEAEHLQGHRNSVEIRLK
ncbi:MAG: histidinol dehydrogenase [Bacteroidota bacterium]